MVRKNNRNRRPQPRKLPLDKPWYEKTSIKSYQIQNVFTSRYDFRTQYFTLSADENADQVHYSAIYDCLEKKLVCQGCYVSNGWGDSDEGDEICIEPRFFKNDNRVEQIAYRIGEKMYLLPITKQERNDFTCYLLSVTSLLPEVCGIISSFIF